jgi:signal transduction histidine kinase
VQALLKKFSSAPKKEREAFAELGRLIAEANTRAREMAHGLMPVSLRADGLMGSLSDLTESVAKTSEIKCRFHCDPPVFVDAPKAATQLYRIAQEALTNALKHGAATRIDVSLNASSHHITLRIEDDGVGISPQARSRGGMGILTMTHRARMLGGGLSVSERTGGGTTIACTVPADADAAGSTDSAHLVPMI